MTHTGLVLCRTLTFRDYTLYGYVCYCDPYNQTNVKQEMLRQAAHHFDTVRTPPSPNTHASLINFFL